MGSVLYLPRGLQRKEASLTAATTTPDSILRPGYNCFAVARAERVALLVDAEAYFRAFYQAALRAKRSITILGWDFNSQTRLHFDPVPAGGPPALLGDFLNYLVRRRRGLHIHVLNWDYPMVFGTDREFPPLYGFGWKPSRRVHLRYDDTHPVAGSHHQKIVRDRRRGRVRRRHRPHGAALGLPRALRPTIRAASPTASPIRRSTT